MKRMFWGPGGPADVRTTVLAGFVLIALAGAAGCGGEEMASGWCDRVIAIDGASTEWDGAMVPVEETHLAVGILNDEEFLYLCLIASERADQMQILTGGLTLWVDPAGGQDKALGIRYPVGGRPAGDGSGESAGRGEPGERGGRGAPGEPPDLDSLLVRLAPPERLEIRNGEDELLESLALDAAPGIEARIGNENGALVYELRIPLVADGERPFAVGADRGRIGLGLVTAELERPKMERPEGGRMGGGPSGGGGGMGGARGGGGGMGGRPGGGRGGMGAPPGMMGERPEPLDLWARVILASAPSADPSGD